ncbi:MAG: right-handed parallel beta-helix repeat-containing protein [Pirellulales bacterium]|nr:right-handed parallel beta-helix repeat-containing protein [Pirellulales bacterium]
MAADSDRNDSQFAAAHMLPAASADIEGNSRSTATYLGSLGLRKTASGCGNFEGDQDYFKFNPSRSGTVSLTLSTYDNLRTQFRRYFADGSSRLVHGYAMNTHVAAGQTVTFNVRAVEGLGNYKLTLRLTPDAVKLGEIQSKLLRNQHIRGEKWFQFSSSNPGSLRAESWIGRSTQDIRLELYDAEFQKLATSKGRYKDDITVDAASDEVFYLHVAGSNGSVKLRLTSNPENPFAAGISYYVATDGSDANDGSLNRPFATLQKVVRLVNPGDTIFVRGGTYSVNAPLQLVRPGAENNPIRLWAYQNERVVLDFAATPTNFYQAVSVQTNWWHLKGLTIEHSSSFGLKTNGSHNIYENMTFRWNAATGMSLIGTNGLIPSDNLFLNCDSYENYDAAWHGENADGFGLNYTIGTGNRFHGCRAWGNSDDGWDLWEASQAVTVVDSWSYRNGVNLWNDANFQGDGNGFKLGRDSGAHFLTNCLAWENSNNGFDTNGNGYCVHIYNCTAYANGARNWQIENLTTHVLRNNISLDGATADFVGSSVNSVFNSWNGLGVGSIDFVSLDSSVARGPRPSDGSLPVSSFLHLAINSRLVDAGVSLGFAFQGAAPDLGAFET